jgi:hypothetical protein
MRTLALTIFCAILTVFSTRADAQLVFSGEASATVLDADGALKARVPNSGKATFGWRFDLFADAIVAENVSFISNIRVFQNEDPAFDFLAIRLTDLTPLGLNLQVGKFDLPFGNLGERRFVSRNPLYSLPLPYEYATALPSTPISFQEMLGHRGAGIGMRMLDFGMYDVGAMVYGSWQSFGYAFAIANGTVSATSNRLSNSNGDFGKIVRLTWSPMQEIVLGGGYAWGAYPSAGTTSSSYPDDPVVSTSGNEQQRTMEADVEFNTGHLTLFAQAVHGVWDVPFETEPGKHALAATGWYGEAKYTFMPHLYGAVRASGVLFSDVVNNGVTGSWDAGLQEFEAGIGYTVTRNVITKLVYRHTIPNGGGSPQAKLGVAQIVVRF